MPISDAKRRANKKWDAANTKQLNLSLGKNEYQIIVEYCESRKIAKATFIRQAIKEKMEREPVK